MSVSNCNSKNTRQIAVFSIVIAGLRHTCTQTLRAATHIATVVRSPWQQRVATGGGGGEGGDEWPSRVGGDEVGRATRGSVAGDDSGLKRDLCVGGSCQREGRGASRTAPAPSTTLPAPAVGSRGGGGGAVGRHTALPDGDDPPVPAGAFREACHDAHGRCAQPRLREHLSYRGAARARESRRCVREGGVGGSRTASADDEGVPVPTDGHADAACRGAHEGDAQTPLKPHLAPAQGGMGGAANRRSAGSWRGAWL